MKTRCPTLRAYAEGENEGSSLLKIRHVYVDKFLFDLEESGEGCFQESAHSLSLVSVDHLVQAEVQLVGT